MPRVRFRLPVEVDLTETDLQAVEKVFDVAKRVKESGIVDSVRELGKAAAAAYGERTKRRRPAR